MIAANLFAIGYIAIYYVARIGTNYSLLAIVGIGISFIVTDQEISDINLAIQNISSYVYIIAFMDAQRYIKADKDLIKFISRITLIVSVVFAIYANMPFAYRVESDALYLEKNALTMGYSNPSAVAILLLFFLVMSMIAFRAKLYSKKLSVLLYIEYLYLIYLTRSRAVLIAVVVLMIMNFVSLKRISKWVPYMFMLLPLITVFLMPYLKQNDFLTDFEFFGETIYTGREEMFEVRLRYLTEKQCWLLVI